jgi:isoleucyl-tRNA synthetase
MDYKDTLNLPRTDFPMKADLVTREPQRLEKWQAQGLYAKVQAARTGGARFVLHDGPPFANGDVHIGTAGNKILKDFIVRYHTLRGRYAPYVPGWDCHGLPIEFKVTQELRRAGHTTADPVAIRTACEAYARKFIDIQRTQFQRLGVQGDWEHPYLTLNKEYEAEELRLFADLVEKGFVYRGKKPVYWSIPCRTALAEAEVEYQDHLSQSVYVKFPLVGYPGLNLLLWTTTPWTLPANLAVAYNSTFSYSLVRAGEESYILSTTLLPIVAEKCGWGGYEIVRSLEAAQLADLEYQHPFCNRTGRLHPGDTFVDNSTGTGFVHIAPGHGLEDYVLGSQVGLPIYSPVDDEGCFTHTDDLPASRQMPAEMLGKSILEKHGKSEANAVVLHELRVRHALVHQENYHHSYPHCWRSKTPVIFRAMNQWFIKIDHCPPGAPAETTLRELALAALDQITWIPAWGRNRMEGAVQARPDWCISRQRSWGVPIPAFYDAQGRPILQAQIVRKAADLVEQHGSNVWFDKPLAELWAAVRPEGWTGPEPAAKASDTLDVWIDSGSSSRSVLMRRAELRRGGGAAGSGSAPGGESDPTVWQAEMYLEGSDQHRGWFQSSLLLSLAGNGAPPFQTVLTHGFMVDAERDKISKSKQGQGGYEKPQTAEVYIRKWGADILRLWIASQDYRGDVVVSEERINKVAESYRGIRNTLRYQLSNLYDFDPGRDAVPEAQLTGLDRWVLQAFGQLEAEVIRAYDQYEFHTVYQRISRFAAVELSAIFHDLVKDRLYTDAANSPRRRSTQTALYRLVTGLCRLLAPLIPFTADEAWEMAPGRPLESVHLAEWQAAGLTMAEKERDTWKRLLAVRDRVLLALEQARQEKAIGKALEARVILEAPDGLAEFLTEHHEALREVLNVSGLEVQRAGETPVEGQQDLASGGHWPRVRVAKAEGQKCERCWHWEADVGALAGHPTICGRCARAIGAA